MTTPPTEALLPKDKPTPKKVTWLGLYGPATDRFLTHGVGHTQYVRYPATEKHALKLPMPE